MRRSLPLLATALALVLTACGGSSGSVEVDDPWGRPSPMSAGNAAFYMELTGGDEDDILVAALSNACGTTELHETTMDDGVMSMRQLPGGFPIPAGETVLLEPGGLHVMCIDADTFEVGDTVELDLQFESGESTTVDAEIRELAEDG